MSPPVAAVAIVIGDRFALTQMAVDCGFQSKIGEVNAKIGTSYFPPVVGPATAVILSKIPGGKDPLIFAITPPIFKSKRLWRAQICAVLSYCKNACKNSQ